MHLFACGIMVIYGFRIKGSRLRAHGTYGPYTLLHTIFGLWQDMGGFQKVGPSFLSPYSVPQIVGNSRMVNGPNFVFSPVGYGRPTNQGSSANSAALDPSQ